MLHELCWKKNPLDGFHSAGLELEESIKQENGFQLPAELIHHRKATSIPETILVNNQHNSSDT